MSYYSSSAHYRFIDLLQVLVSDTEIASIAYNDSRRRTDLGSVRRTTDQHELHRFRT